MRTLLVPFLAFMLVTGDATAQGFQIEEVPSVDAVPVAQVKPRSIFFSDRGSDEIAESGGIFIRYEDWLKMRPLQQQFLSLYPGYTEPDADVVVDGTKRHYREKLHMYVAQARFVIAKAPSSLDLSRYVTAAFAQQLDPAIKHQVIA